ncbi:MAG: hypothetical protein REV35_00600 [Burkholderia sp.]|nr:hypothetical protein [Burkholderia sp.]
MDAYAIGSPTGTGKGIINPCRLFMLRDRLKNVIINHQCRARCYHLMPSGYGGGILRNLGGGKYQ